MAFHLAVAGDIRDGVLFCAVFFHHEMSCMRSGTPQEFSYQLFQKAKLCFQKMVHPFDRPHSPACDGTTSDKLETVLTSYELKLLLFK